MIFIEMFDQSSTMSKQAISQEFFCSLEFADFLVRMRNKLIHERMSLWRATPLVHQELHQFQPQWSCAEIDFSGGDYEKISILFFLHTEAIVNRFIVSHVEYTGPYDDNSLLITDIESQMVEQGEGGNASPATS